jgi:hypothetical protein
LQNNPSETVWKIGISREMGFRRRSIGAKEAAIGGFLPPKKRAQEAFGYFPNSFSTVDFSHSRRVANRLG